MNQITQKFFVSSADWEIVVDHTNHKKAVLSAMIMAFKKFGKNLLVSTVIMVRDEESMLLDDVTKAEFFATHKIFKSLGLKKLSQNFKEYTKLKDES
jgi:hypothetical protein